VHVRIAALENKSSKAGAALGGERVDIGVRDFLRRKLLERTRRGATLDK